MAFLRTPSLPHLNKESSIRKASLKVNRSEPFCARNTHTGSASVSSPSSHTEARSTLSWKQEMADRYGKKGSVRGRRNGAGHEGCLQ